MRRRAWLGVSCAVVSAAVGCEDQPAQPDSGILDSALDGLGADGANDASSDAFDAGSTVCSASATWGTDQPVSISTAQADLLGAITGDELTIAWMTTQGAVLYADRQSTSSAFGAPQTLAGAIALDQVALSSDGLAMIVVLQDRSALAQTTRASRAAAFSTTLDTTPFAQLDPPPTEGDGGASQGSFADPVLSNDGTLLYYSQTGVNVYTMHESYRAGASGPWPQGRILIEPPLVATSLTARRRPSGLSIDGRTLFFWDESTSIERVAFRGSVQSPNATYTTFADLGAYENAEPTASCTRIYFSASGSGGLDLFYADKQ